MEKAEALNNYFSSVFTSEDIDNIPETEYIFNSACLTTIDINPDLVKAKLLSLNGNKSSGPDSVHPFFLKKMSNVLSEPLSILYLKSLQMESCPRQWLEAIITAIHKKGPRYIPGNYRPISLTSVISKIMEKIVRDAIVQHMTKNQLFADAQHGFVDNRTCITQLLVALEAWGDVLENGGTIDVIYTDFSKAFDSIPHKRLLVKIKSLGITGKVLKWIESFLGKRRQKVRIEGSCSKWADVRSGIPQGSVLGPILFVLFINDMPQVVSNMCNLFADDAKLSGNVSKSTTCLQDDLDNLCKWSSDWQLPFNIKKCKCLHIGNRNPGISYHMYDQTLEEVDYEKDLGILIDSQLKFHQHTAAAVKKANQILGIIKRSFALLDEFSLPLLYKSMVRPHLEYGNVIWGPHFKLDQQAVERVQRRATKLVTSISHLNYQQRLKQIKLPSLMYRRRRGDMIQTFKIMNNLVNIGKEIFFKSNTLSTRGHPFKIYKQSAKTKLRSQSFSRRVTNDWNSLPAEVVSANSLNEFKNKLDKFWVEEQYTTPFLN